MPKKKLNQVRKLRATSGGSFPKDAKRVKVASQRTQHATSRALTFLERYERRAFIRGMRELKPQIEEWARYIRHTQGADSADLAEIRRFWGNMVARYKSYRTAEAGYKGKKPSFDPDINGKVYG